MARSSITARTTSAASGAPTPAAWLRIRLTWSCVQLVGRDPDVGELAEAGVDPVDRLPRRDGGLDETTARDQRVRAAGRVDPEARRPGGADDVRDVSDRPSSVSERRIART